MLAISSVIHIKFIKKLFLFFGVGLIVVNTSGVVFSQTDDQAEKDRKQAEKDRKVFIKGLIEGKVPQASARGTLLWSTGIFSKCPNGCDRLNDLTMMLSNALRETGYSEQGWGLTRK